ncbi:MAG: DUF3488 domain-containing protein, partial [Myxococcales bacterium]|nr:DUF3488 domain-containing protein [Myxococcales bacterium]
MNVLSLHKRLTYLLVLLPVLVLVAGGEMNLVVMSVFAAGFLFSWFWEPPRIEYAAWERRWTWVNGALLVLTVLRLVQMGELDIGPMLDLVLLLTVVKLMQRESTKDYIQILTLSFLLLAAASAYNQGLVFGLMFLLYMVVGTLTLSVKHLREELTQHHRHRLEGFRVEASFIMTVAGLALTIAVFTLVFFLTFPRLGAGFFNTNQRAGVAVSGFGESVELGTVGRVREDRTVIMRVSFPDSPGAPTDDLRWRGTAYDEYDGRTWVRGEYVTSSAIGTSTAFYAYPYRRPDFGDEEGEPIRQEIVLEPLTTNVLFGLPGFSGVSF